MEALKTVGIAAVTTLVVLAIANRVEIPLINPRLTAPRPAPSSAGSQPATGGA